MLAQVSLVRCTTYEQRKVDEALERALSLIGGLDWVTAGMNIVVKPNLIMRKHPDTACTTHPNVLASLVSLLVSREAHVVIGDSPGGPFTEYVLRSVYEGTHLSRLAQLGAVLNYDVGSYCVPCNGKVLSRLEIARFVAQADAVISFAKLKTHSLMGFSGAVKNLYGVVPGTIKFDYHQRFPDKADFADMVIDIAQHIAPRLSIIDAIVGMEGPGPTGGTPRQIGALIASADPYAADVVGAELVGIDPLDVPILSQAQKRGICPGGVADVQLSGDPFAELSLRDYEKINPEKPLPFLVGMLNWKPVHRIFQNRPVVEPNLCVGCGECQRSCPPKAIDLVNKKPVFDRAKCIRCFCCQELCPKTAIRVERTKLAKAVEAFGNAKARQRSTIANQEKQHL